MNEEFIKREEIFNEESAPSEIESFITTDKSKVLEFESRLAEELPRCKTIKEIAQTVVATALTVEGLKMKDNDIIVEALLQNKEKIEEARLLAERIMKKNIH